MAGGGNQAVTGMESRVAYLLDDPRVTAVGLLFEGLRDVAGLRRAAVRALELGKPIVAIKFGKTAAGSAGRGLAQRMNYLAASGVLALVCDNDGKPIPPQNLVGDYAAGGGLAFAGVLAALHARATPGSGNA